MRSSVLLLLLHSTYSNIAVVVVYCMLSYQRKVFSFVSCLSIGWLIGTDQDSLGHPATPFGPRAHLLRHLVPQLPIHFAVRPSFCDEVHASKTRILAATSPFPVLFNKQRWQFMAMFRKGRRIEWCWKRVESNATITGRRLFRLYSSRFKCKKMQRTNLFRWRMSTAASKPFLVVLFSHILDSLSAAERGNLYISQSNVWVRPLPKLFSTYSPRSKF